MRQRCSYTMGWDEEWREERRLSVKSHVTKHNARGRRESSASMSAVTIRPARAGDAQRVRDLERMIVEASLPIVREVRSGTTYASSGGATIEDALRLVAVAAGSLKEPEEGAIGMTALTMRVASADHVPLAHIRALAVAEPCRRRGIGMQLLRHAEAWAREQGMTKLATNVAEENRPALAFFHRAGYHKERGMMVKYLADGHAYAP